ncbi:MAG: biotin/lipoyl-binding protein [Pirellulales bacterium]|nr:biotin/lipoyl-binding protein [Pirellulales bacterium]
MATEHAPTTAGASASTDGVSAKVPAEGAPVQAPAASAAPTVKKRRWPWIVVGVVAAIVAAIWLIPAIHTALTTVSTDDAYVNSHVTFVAPRVAGQVVSVLVDDNNRVRKGDLLVQLDKQPFASSQSTTTRTRTRYSSACR